ncbi:MAG: hypothetical protein AB1431_07165 [Pseudomonadota bacterium]
MNDMVDMSQFVEAKSDQLNADDLIGAPRTITVRKVTGNDGDQPVSIFYEGDNNKPFKPCKTMRRVLLGVWGRNAADYVGRSMTLYRDDAVTFGGLNVGGIRISHMSHIDKETMVVVMKTKGKKAGIKIQPLRVEQRQQETEDRAAKWAVSYIAKVHACDDMDALIALENSQAARLDELKQKRPELAQKIAEAAQSRSIALAKEGKPKSDMGDGFDGFDADTGEVE